MLVLILYIEKKKKKGERKRNGIKDLHREKERGEEREANAKQNKRVEDKTQYVDSSKPYKYIPPKRVG